MSTDDVIFGNIHAVLALLSGFMSKCWLLVIMLNLIAIVSNKSSMNLPKFKLLYFLIRVANMQWPSYLIGFIMPILVTLTCLLVGGMPKSQQKMMISLSKSQLMISNCLLGFLVLFIFYMLIVFARIKTKQSITSLLRNKAQTMRNSSRQRYYSLAGDSQQADENETQNNTTVRLEHEANDVDINEDVSDEEGEAKNFVPSNHQKNSEFEEIQARIYNG
jgi:hypothetical protein